jgi:serine/threonine-protein kinase
VSQERSQTGEETDPERPAGSDRRRIGGRYEITGLLGEGGMGRVFAARHVFTGQEVALKLPRMGVLTEEAAARFLREARLPHEIGHPSIAGAIDAGVDADGSVYLVLERLRGESLEQALAAGRVGPGEVIDVVLVLLDVLAAAHARGLVHRDVKPDNVFLSERPPRVRLLDFGIARAVLDASSVTRTGTVLGTPAYMSPEQLRGERVDARADLWSVGALLFRALAGRPPFVGDDDALLLTAVLEGRSPVLRDHRPELGGPLSAVIERALRPIAGERFRSAAEMAAALRGARESIGPKAFEPTELAPLRVASAPPPPPTRATAPVAPGPATRWRRWLVVTAALAAIGAAAAFGVYRVGAPEEPARPPAPSVRPVAPVPLSTPVARPAADPRIDRAPIRCREEGIITREGVTIDGGDGPAIDAAGSSCVVTCSQCTLRSSGVAVRGASDAFIKLSGGRIDAPVAVDAETGSAVLLESVGIGGCVRSSSSGGIFVSPEAPLRRCPREGDAQRRSPEAARRPADGPPPVPAEDDATGDTTIRVDSDPPGRVYLNGRPTGRSTPVVLSVTPGQHRVAVERPDGTFDGRYITVVRGEQGRVRLGVTADGP